MNYQIRQEGRLLVVKTDSRKLLQKDFYIKGDGQVNVGVNIYNVPEKIENRIKKETEDFIDSVYGILQEISAE